MRAIGTRLGRLEHVAGVTTETYAQMHLRAVREAARRNAVETQVRTEPAGSDGDEAATHVENEERVHSELSTPK